MIRASLLALAGAAFLSGCTADWDTSNNGSADTRLARDTAIDAELHGPEIAGFIGAKPGNKVIDLIPGGGYWTRTFARIVGPAGHVYGVWPKAYADGNARRVQSYARTIRAPAFANTSAIVQPGAPVTPEKVDLVFLSGDYHDYAGGRIASDDAATLNKAVFAALKPGGSYVVIDSVAAAGSDPRKTAALGRVDPALVRKQVTDAGFVLAAESRLLASAEDDHAKSARDPAVRGRADQFIYKFTKP